MLNESQDRLVVVVKDGRYDCYGDLASPRMSYLLGFLQGMGSVNESVKDGTYHFNVEQVEDRLIATLDPAE